MKKIIYSFVIMIAAGSLFTSCVTNTEPQGIKDIREAKADYLESLVNLKNAEAEKEKAKAAKEQADADYRQAEVAFQQILNEIKQCESDARKAQLTQELKYWETKLKEQEKALAWAEYDLQQTLKDIAVYSEKLTDAERTAVDTYTWEYEQYITAQQNLREAQAWLYYANDNYADYVSWLETKNVEAASEIALVNELIDALPIDSTYEEAKKFQDKVNDSINVLRVDSVNLSREFNLFKAENVNPSIKAFSKDLSAWFVQNVALPAPFHLAYKAELPDNEVVVNALRTYLNRYKTKGFTFSDDGTEIAANFSSSADARRYIFGDGQGDSTNVRSLFNVVDALSRELVIDPAATSVDTVGLAKAVADAKTEYTKVEAALEAGADAYAADALDHLKAMKQAKAEADAALDEAEAEYAAQKDSLKAAIENFVNVWNEIADDDQVMDKNDTTDLWKAFQNLIKVRAAVLPYEGEREYFYYRKGKDNDGKIDTGKIKFIDLKKGQILKTNARIKALDDVQFGGSETSLSDAINQFFGCQYFRDHMSIINPDGKLTKVDYDELFAAANTNQFLTLFFGEYFSDYTVSKIYKSGNVLYKPATLLAAEEAAADAQTEVDNATKAFVAKHKEFYTDVYGKFWGIDMTAKIDSAKEVKVSEEEKVLVWKFVDNYTPLVQNFTKETFTKTPAIVTFEISANSYKSGRDPKFSQFDVKDNDELHIVWEQLDKNQDGELKKQNIEFSQLLLAKLFFKEAVLAKYSAWDTEGIEDALAALDEIVKDVKAAYYEAADKQVEASQPFFTFLKGLIGEDVLDELFERLDNAIAVYNDYKPAVPGDDYFAFVIEQIAGGTISSKEVVIAAFENFICAQAENENYKKAYIALQMADAFAGDQIEALLLDVLEKFVDALDIDIVSKNPGNIVEKLLFGTVNVGKFSSDGLFKTAFNIIVPTITSYIVSDFGGIIGDLIEEHFTEWAAEWAEYDQAVAAINAKIETLRKLKAVYDIFTSDIDAVKADYETRKDNAEAILNWTADALAAIEAGADSYTVWMEKVTDWVEYLSAKVEAAAVKFEAAEAAYNQVIKNHE